MEQITKLVAEQQKLVSELTRKLSNMKKDSKVRKTEKYLDDRSNDIEVLWQQFSSRHSEILELDAKKETKYAKSEIYGEVEELYNKARIHIYDCQEALKATEEKKCWEIKLVEQARRIEILEADAESAQLATEGFAQYLEDIKKQFTAIMDNDVELSRIPAESRESEYFKENWFQLIRQKYREATVFLDKKMRERDQATPSTSSSSGSNCNLVLPKLKIPIFSGKYDEWPTFKDIFIKVIDTSNHVSKVEKMQYLKTYVKGEAKDAIQHFEITESNYDSAWKELKERYDNKRRIVNMLINKILQLPVMQNESAEQLKSMYNTIKECMEALKMQEIETSSWDAIIVCVVANKWDSRTNQLFETNMGDSFQIQSLDSMLKFILKRFQAMEASGFQGRGEISNTIPSFPNNTNNTNCSAAAVSSGFQEDAKKSSGPDCPVSNMQPTHLNKLAHSIFLCEKIKSCSTFERSQIVEEENNPGSAAASTEVQEGVKKSSGSNCVIYNRMDNTSCGVIQKQIKNLVRKQFDTNNSWQFIAPGITKGVVSCSGNRKDIKINKPRIIAIFLNCIITTKKIILPTKENSPVFAAFARPVAANLTMSTNHSLRSIPADGDVITLPIEINTPDEEINIQDEIQSTNHLLWAPKPRKYPNHFKKIHRWNDPWINLTHLIYLLLSVYVSLIMLTELKTTRFDLLNMNPISNNQHIQPTTIT